MVAVFVGVLERVPVLQDALVGAAVGALIGNGVASRWERRNPELKAAHFAVRWTWVGTGFGVLAHVVWA